MIKSGKPVPTDVETRIPRAAEVLARDARIEAVWLFGSRARAEADELSDVDLAVLVRNDVDGQTLWDAQIEWTNLAIDALQTDEVGLQVINRLPVAIRHAILCDARLLWARSPEIASDFVARTVKEFLDFKPYLDRYDRELFQQAATGRLR